MLFRISKLFLYASVFFIAIVSTSTLFPFIVGKYVWFRMCIDLALIFFALGILFDSQGASYIKRLRELMRMPVVVAVTVFTAVFLISSALGSDPSFSFWSNFERGEGGVQILHLYLFFMLLMLLFQKRSEWKKIFWCSVIGAVLMIAYGIGAGLKMGGFVGPAFSEPGVRFQGSIGNPAYVAAYLVFGLFYSLYLLFTSYRVKKFASVGTWLAAAASVLFLVFFFFAATRGAFVGLVAATVVAVGYLAYADRRLRKWLLAAGAGMLLIVGILVWQRNSDFVKRLPVGRVFDISFSTETFKDRTIMWRIAWRGFLDKPVLGWGPESFQHVFDRYFDKNYFEPAKGFGAWFDRAHSVFFDYLVAIGAAGLLSYLSIFALLYVRFFRKARPKDTAPAASREETSCHIQQESKVTHALIAALPVAYLVQGLVLFDVLAMYVNIFLFLAFATWELSPSGKTGPVADIKQSTRQRVSKRSYSPFIITLSVVMIGLAVFSMIFASYLPLRKSQRFIRVLRGMGSVRTVGDFTSTLESALAFPSPVGQEEVVKFAAGNVLEVISQQGQQENAARKIVDYIEPYMFKNDVRHLLTLAQMYEVLWKHYGHEEDFAKAEYYYRQGLSVNPTIPPLLYGLLSLYNEHRDREKLAEVATTILANWPDDARVQQLLFTLQK